ncbi:MAG: hypothetical protein M1127_02740, partial [Patescibacteria group bacterium]|nr:hypothetical protein [Patescibacteria group bacterium]
NVWSKKTCEALQKTSIKKVISSRYMQDSCEPMQGIGFIDDKNGFFCMHDKDIKEKGAEWLNKLLEQL